MKHRRIERHASSAARTRLAILLVALAAAPLAGEVVVESVSRGLGESATPGDARCLRFADGLEVDLEPGMVLSPGDELWSEAENVDVRLECGEDANHLLSGRFRAFVDFPGDRLCSIKRVRGDLDVLADAPIQIDIGGIVLGNEGTQFAVRPGKRGNALAEVLVYDGLVRASAPGQAEEVRTGSALELERSRRLAGTARRLDRRDVEHSAAVYARTDLALARHRNGADVDPGREFQEFMRLHAEVLTDPGNAGLRAALARAQIRIGLNDDAFYHLKRGDLLRKKKLKRNGIDREQLERGLSPGNRAELDAALARGGFGRALGTALAIGAGAVLVHEVLDDDDKPAPEQPGDGGNPSTGDAPDPTARCRELAALLARGEIARAQDQAEASIRAKQATSCDYYAVAKGFELRQDFRQRSTYCKAALTAHERDRLLTGAQIEDCQPSHIR